MPCAFFIISFGGCMSITFEQIGKFFVDNMLWFLIPIDIAILVWIIVVIVQYRKGKGKKNTKNKKRGKKNERKRQDKLSKPS